MSSAASLDINVLDIDNSDNVSRYDTSLIKIETILTFSLFFSLEIFDNAMAFKNDPVSLVLDRHLDFFSDRRVMSDIQMSIILCLFGSTLPYVWT